MQAGGTIDKDYRRGANVYNFEIADPAAERILKRVDPLFTYRFIPLLRKDSMDMTEEDRQLILETCQKVPESHIVITHGTDTMTKTAETLQTITDKIIVLTGSAMPELFAGSDADFNVGMAVGALTILERGIYIAMSGRVLPWDQIHKDPETGQFVGR